MMLMNGVLAIDIGGSHVKVRIPEDPEKRRFESGPELTPGQMVDGVRKIVEGWDFDRVSIGIPAPISKNTAMIDPVNLGEGWAGFDFSGAFGIPTRIVNDAAMQAIGSYEGGSMLFMGLGTGLGTCLIDRYVVHPTEIAHMPYKGGKTFEEVVGEAGLEESGKKDWKKSVLHVVDILYKGLLPDYIVLGGGNSKKFKDDDKLPDYCRKGDNANAFLGGFRMWEKEWENGVG
jgi:polyphosphate glucokinase